MPQLQGELVVRANAPFGRASTNSVRHRIAKLNRAEQAARRKAADTATQVSRREFRYLRKPITGAQRGSRESTGGRFASHIEWAPEGTGVALNLAEMDAKAPHWVILEIGTGRRAKMRFGGDETPGVRARSAQLRTVPSQRGRRIHGSLVFADGPGGDYSPPGASRTQQLFFRDQVTGAPRYRRQIRIKREIKGQHFIQKGARAGFRQYRTTVLAAAREAFRKGAS